MNDTMLIWTGFTWLALMLANMDQSSGFESVCFYGSWIMIVIVQLILVAERLSR